MSLTTSPRSKLDLAYITIMVSILKLEVMDGHPFSDK